MTQKIDFKIASSAEIETYLCARLEAFRLSQNMNQSELAKRASISLRTLTRLATGEGGVSFDTIIRVMLALNLHHHLENFIPDPTVRPIERVQFKGKQRQRARRKPTEAEPWTWADDGSTK